MKRLLMICLFVGCTVAMKGQYWYATYVDKSKVEQIEKNLGFTIGEYATMAQQNSEIETKELGIFLAASTLQGWMNDYITSLKGGITQDYLRYRNIGKKVEKMVDRMEDIVRLAQKNHTSIFAITGTQYITEYRSDLAFITKTLKVVVGEGDGDNLLRIDQRVALLREVDKRLDNMLYIVNKLYDRMCLFDKNGFLVFSLYDMGLYNKYQVADYKTQIAKEIVEDHFKHLKR